MTREEAIHYLERIKQEYDCSYEEEALEMSIQALEQTRWIPVSERLPEVNEPVLIFQRYYSGVNITIGQYHSDEDHGGYRYWQWIKYDNDFRYGIEHFGIICPDSYYVDAWMPLPEPYLPDTNIGNMSEIPTGSESEE